ncbi:MAG: barstar family protein [Chitinophagaceae bacterium]
MNKRTITINGNNFSNLEEFFNEVDNVLTKDLDWKTGHNFSAFNDLLCGGFGVHEYDESIKLVWQNSEKSKQDLNEMHEGQTIYETLVEILVDYLYRWANVGTKGKAL